MQLCKCRSSNMKKETLVIIEIDYKNPSDRYYFLSMVTLRQTPCRMIVSLKARVSNLGMKLGKVW